MNRLSPLDSATWRKSSRSQGQGANCVELAQAPGIVAVRDSKDPDGPKLAFARRAMKAFIARVQSGNYDQ